MEIYKVWDDVDFTPEECCEICGEIIHNHFDCPICNDINAGTSMYCQMYDCPEGFSCEECDAEFEWVELGISFKLKE